MLCFCFWITRISRKLILLFAYCQHAREQALFDAAKKVASTSIREGGVVQVSLMRGSDETPGPVLRSRRKPAPILTPSPTKPDELEDAKPKRAPRRPASKVERPDPGFVLLRDGAVKIGDKVFHPYEFRWFHDANWRPTANTVQDVVSCSHLVFFAGGIYDEASFTWRNRLIFVNTPGKYCAYAGTHDDVCFNRVTSLHNLGLDSRAWWLKPGMTIPPVTPGRQPGETEVFPRYKRPFVAGELVAIRKHAYAQGFVQRVYKRPDGKRVYYVYGVTSEDVDPRNPRWKGVYYQEELATPMITWRPIAHDQMWWIYHAAKYLASPEMRDAFLYWPTPVGGWSVGDIVSIPFDDTGARHVARVASILDADHYLVEFPVLEESESPLTEVYRTDVVLGPHTLWTLPEYKWAKLRPAELLTLNKRPRSPSPLSLGSNAKLAKMDETAGEPVLKTDEPGLQDNDAEPDIDPLIQFLRTDEAMEMA